MSHLELERPELSAARKLTIATWRPANDPTMYAISEMTMDAALGYVEEFRKATGRRLTVTHMAARAVAEALRRTPETNGLLRWNRIYLRKRIGISMPVMMEEKNADGTERFDLAAINIQDVADKNLVQITDEVSEKIAAVRNRQDPNQERARSVFKYVPCLLISFLLRLFSIVAFALNIDLSRFGVLRDPFGSVIISNIGSIGLDSAYAPLVPYARVPIVFTLGAVQPRPVVEDEEIVIRKQMQVGISADHRFMDGYHMAVMARTLKEWLARPYEHFGPIPQSAEASPTEQVSSPSSAASPAGSPLGAMEGALQRAKG
jgi:pyruvate dehydrogenase E2 component (dihydrolipoamide acetyltransferase)